MAAQIGHNDAGGSDQGTAFELRPNDLPSKRLLGKGLASIGYETELNGLRFARKDFVGVPISTFRREAIKFMSLEDHENVVKAHGLTFGRMCCSLVLEYMDDDLLGFLQKRKESRGSRAGTDSGNQSGLCSYGPLELPEVFDVMVQIARGMESLHGQGIPHGDLKTKNILVTHNMNDGDKSLLSVKVADFGLVRTKQKSMSFVSRQARKHDMVHWKAPEILEMLLSEDRDETTSESSDSSSDDECTRPSGVTIGNLLSADVYSFAVTCYQILTGEGPYSSLNWKELKSKIVSGELRPNLPAACPPSLRNLLVSCWGNAPAQRPTFSHIRTELELLLIPPKLRLPWSSDNSDCQNAQECLKRTVSCINGIERCTGSWHFNHLLCEELVTNYLRPAREFLEERKDKIELYSEQCAPPLTAIHNTVKEANFLIQQHCTGSRSSWIFAAVELVENTSAFAEVILDLKRYMHALKIAIEVAPRQAKEREIWILQSIAMAEYGKLLENWESDCKQLRLERDREVLLSKLEIYSGAEIWSWGSFLAQKLGTQEHAMEALAVNVKASDLLQQKVLLGWGSFGEVYRVQWLGRPCALKQISESAVDEEVRIISKLHHPNIIQLYGHFLERGTLYLIMELMESTLSEHIETEERTDLQRSPLVFLRVALDCMLQIAKGVRYLHSQGMPHPDLKGGNVLVKPSENPDLWSKGYLTVKLIEFGLTKGKPRNPAGKSRAINIRSFPWKAPELFKVVQPDLATSSKRNRYPFKPDVYSFGMVCYEILSGKKPFSDTPIMLTSVFYAKVKKGERPELPESVNLLPGLSDYIKRCWDTDPLRRPDFVDICKRIRHFRDSLLQISAYSGWEDIPQESGAVMPEPSTIDDNNFIDITDEGNWEIVYKDIVLGDKKLPGGSGFASVWPAWWRTSEQVLAKFIEPTLIDNDEKIAEFKHEIGLLVGMQHENLVCHLGATRQAPFVVFTEFAHGVTLRKLTGERASFSHLDAVKIALHVARGMRSLHEEDVTVIHGELTRDCILIDEDNMTARVADFGIQSFRMPPHSHRMPPHSHSHSQLAPEQHLGLPLHTSVDVISFGMILYELFECDNAHNFWKQKRASDILKKGGRPELGLASCYPNGVRALIERCWTPNWQERPRFGPIVSDLQKISTMLDYREALLNMR